MDENQKLNKITDKLVEATQSVYRVSCIMEDVAKAITADDFAVMGIAEMWRMLKMREMPLSVFNEVMNTILDLANEQCRKMMAKDSGEVPEYGFTDGSGRVIPTK